MKKTNYDWKLTEAPMISAEFQAAINELKLNPLLGKILWQRAIQSPEQLQAFLQPTEQTIHDPFLFFDMEKAVERIHQAIAAGEQILVYGDYDADGITSTTVMKEAVELIGGEVEYFLPNRFVHGYGPNLSVFKEKIEQGITLIITVDNGVSGHEAIHYAMAQGVDVIVTDHHELPPELPNAYALIHPRHPKGSYPFGDLAGVGVAFKVATALLGELPEEFLDMVAIGTIADLVSLKDENRTLVQLGLKVIHQGERIGLNTLIRTASLTQDQLNEENIGFAIGPRLNALGRLGDAGPGVELMTTFDDEEAAKLAHFIEEQNIARKEIVAKITEEALAMVAADQAANIYILAKQGWHEGVLGIVAGRVMQETGKPALVLTIDEENIRAKGSGRSVTALNLFEALNGFRDQLTHFGGHHMAAGLTLPVANLPALKEYLLHYLAENQIDLSRGQTLAIDEQLSLKEASIDFIQQLKQLAPFGMDNPMPTFLFKDVAVEQLRQIGGDNRHLKLSLIEGGTALDAVAFDMGAQIGEFSNAPINSLVGQLSINEWNGSKKPQLLVKDFEVTGMQVFDLRGKRARHQELPLTKSLYLLFDEKDRKILPKESQDQQLVYENLAQVEAFAAGKMIEQLVIVDCPAEQDAVKEIISALAVKRIYLMCYSREEMYLNGIGTRDQFARLFKFIHQHKNVDVRYKTKTIAEYLKLPESLLIFMIRVFYELGFVTIENGVLNKVDNPPNHPLTDSVVYQQRQKQIQAEEFLLYSDIATLTKWFEQ